LGGEEILEELFVLKKALFEVLALLIGELTEQVALRNFLPAELLRVAQFRSPSCSLCKKLKSISSPSRFQTFFHAGFQSQPKSVTADSQCIERNS
jgi:hypothetical protein